MDNSYQELNRQSTERMRNLAAKLTDEDLELPLGEYWTIAAAFAHIAFWDARVLKILEDSESNNQVIIHPFDLVVNDISLPFWLASPPRQAVELAIATAEELDQSLESFSPILLEKIASANLRFVRRDYHRLAHLDEIEEALNY